MIDVKKKLKKVWLIIIILLIVIGVFVFILLKNSNKKIDNSFSVTKENYSVDSKNNKINLNIKIKNSENSDKELDNVSVSIINNDDQEVFFYVKNVDSTLKKNETYDLNISEDIENSNLKTKKDIKEIKYEVNK